MQQNQQFLNPGLVDLAGVGKYCFRYGEEKRQQDGWLLTT